MQELKKALQKIGRPFGHRTYGAILSYVANYPKPEDYKLAMADQIEMKILPKLRGIDPQDGPAERALDEILEIINRLGDVQLSSAFQESRTNESHQFLWHGVDRLENS